MKNRINLLLFILGTLFIVGCSGFSEDLDQTEKIAVAFYEHCANEEYVEAWKMTHPVFQREFSFGEFKEKMVTSRKRLGQLSGLNIERGEIEASLVGKEAIWLFSATYPNGSAEEIMKFTELNDEYFITAYEINLTEGNYRISLNAGDVQIKSVLGHPSSGL